MRQPSPQEMFQEIRGAMAAFGEEFVTELIDTYLADAPKRLLDLRQARESGDREAFTRAAHTLKSSSACVGARSVSDLAKALEAESRDGVLADLGDYVTRLEQAYLQVKAILEQARDAR